MRIHVPCGMVTGSTLYKWCASNQSCYSFMDARTVIQRHKGQWPRHEKHFTAPLTIPGLLHYSSSSSGRGPGPGRKHNILESTPPPPKKYQWYMLDLRDNFQSFMKKTSISTNTNLSQESQYSVEKHKPWCPLRSEVMGMWENLETIIRSHHPASEVGPHEQDKIQILRQSHRVYRACVHVAPPHLAGSQPQRPPQSRTFCDRLNLTPPRSLCRHSSSLWSVNWLYYNFYPLECFPSENTFFVSRLLGCLEIFCFYDLYS